MTTEETVVPEAEEDKKVEEVEKTEDTGKSEEKESEEKEDFVKGDETVPAAKYNQALRKLREAELEKKERDKQSPREEKLKKSKEEHVDDIYKDDESEDDKVDVEALVEAKVRPVMERLNQKEAEERKNQRTAFFEEHPEYLTDAEAWQELLDEVDNFNPNSKDNHYKQLTKAHRIRSAEVGYSEIDKKKKEMASESASKGDGSQKAADRKTSADERADRLAKDMPKGFVYKERK